MRQRSTFASLSLLTASLGKRLVLATAASAMLWLTILWALN